MPETLDSFQNAINEAMHMAQTTRRDETTQETADRWIAEKGSLKEARKYGERTYMAYDFGSELRNHYYATYQLLLRMRIEG
jgi:hypothetical protein